MLTVGTGDAIEIPAQHALAWAASRVSFDAIANATADVCGYTVNDLLSDRRDRKRSAARQIVMWLAWQLTTLGKAQIGRMMSGRDHTTIIHGIKQVERRIADPTDNTREMVAAVRARVGG